MNKIVLHTEYFEIEEKPTSDKLSPYYVMNCADAAICAVLDQEDNFIMVKQERPALSKTSIEMPAGGIEEGETAEEAMKRELKEEIQSECTLLSLGENYSLMSSRLNMKTYYFFGMNPAKGNWEKAEEVSVTKIPRSLLKNKILMGEFEQVGGITCLYLIQLQIGVDPLNGTYAEIEKAFDDEKKRRADR